jgi:hypothetical protein
MSAFAKKQHWAGELLRSVGLHSTKRHDSRLIAASMT